jgi:hypothetical protein
MSAVDAADIFLEGSIWIEASPFPKNFLTEYVTGAYTPRSPQSFLVDAKSSQKFHNRA